MNRAKYTLSSFPGIFEWISSKLKSNHFRTFIGVDILTKYCKEMYIMGAREELEALLEITSEKSIGVIHVSPSEVVTVFTGSGEIAYLDFKSDNAASEFFKRCSLGELTEDPTLLNIKLSSPVN